MKYPEPDPKIPIVIFDLDGTLAYSVWPNRGQIGEPIPEGVEMLWYYARKGYRTEIYTARPHIDHGLIWNWVHNHGLPIDAVNCGKPFGGLYVDDRAYRPDEVEGEEEWDQDEITRMGLS